MPNAKYITERLMMIFLSREFGGGGHWNEVFKVLKMTVTAMLAHPLT